MPQEMCVALVAQYHEYHDSIYLAQSNCLFDKDACSKAELLIPCNVECRKAYLLCITAKQGASGTKMRGPT